MKCTEHDHGIIWLRGHKLSKIYWRKYTIPEIAFMVKFQAETLYVCPKTCFDYTYTDTAWKSHKKYDFSNTQK